MRLIAFYLSTGCAALALSGCGTPRQALFADERAGPDAYYRDAADEDGGFADIGYAQWTADEPAYRLYPGDEVSVVIPYAPENNKDVVVQQDGRITLPLIGQVMAAGRSIDDIRGEASARYAAELRRPVVEMSVKAAPLKVFVGGEVGNPGSYDLIGDGDALRAIMQAGGFKTSANLRKVIIIRRGADGRAMMRTANMAQALRHGDQPDLVPLRRMDVVFVPRSGAAEVGLLMQQYFRDVLPFSFSYALNGTQQ